MIISAEELMNLDSEFKDQDEKVLQAKLDAVELLIRKYTNNNFQMRTIRFTSESFHDRILGVHPLLKVGDTIEISESENDGLYVIKEIKPDFIRVNKELYNLSHNLITKIKYPDDIKFGIINLMKYEVNMRDKIGIKSEAIGRHSVAYYDMNESEQVMGYPASLLGFLQPYKKARF